MGDLLLEKWLRNRGLQVGAVEGKGRCITATMNFKPGQVLLDQQPYAAVVSDASGPICCDGCFSAPPEGEGEGGEALRRCSACKAVWYCSATCQRSEWKLHKPECRALADLRQQKGRSLPPTLRLAYRLLVKKGLQDKKELPETPTDRFDLVEALPSHMELVPPERALTYRQMASLVCMLRGAEGAELEDVACHLSRLSCNAHTICDPELRPRGLGLYPVVSIMNHSCAPNASLLFEGKRVSVRAVAPIQAGEEVCFSYVELGVSSAARRRSLQEGYHFLCQCARCSPSDPATRLVEDAALEGPRCPRPGCEGVMLPGEAAAESAGSPAGSVEGGGALVCQRCGTRGGSGRFGEAALETQRRAAEAKERGDLEGARSQLEAACAELSRCCHPHSAALRQCRDDLTQVCMDLGDWEAAADWCSKTIPAYKRAYPPNSPLVGLQLFRLAKLKWYLNKGRDALQAGMEALASLRVTHGDNALVQELDQLVTEARAEVGAPPKEGQLFLGP